MKKLMTLVVVALVVAMAATAAVASYKPGGYIEGSRHDFRSSTYTNLAASLTPGYAAGLGADFVTPGAEICRACHVPHNAISDYRLWAKDYVDDANLAVTVGNPGVNSPSTLCMQCHDGTIALATGMSDSITNTSSLGTNMLNDHPVDVSANWAATKVDAKNATTYGPYVTIYGTEVAVTASSHNQGTSPVDLVYSVSADGTTATGYVTCSSCHNVHGMNLVDDLTGAKQKVAKFLVMDNTGSALCQNCHGK